MSYTKIVKVDIMSYWTKYKGQEILDVSVDELRINFEIDMEVREWGIKTLSIYNIIGYDEIEMEISYLYSRSQGLIPNDSGEEMEKTIKLPINWKMLKENELTGGGFISVGDVLNIDLGNDENGDIVIKNLEIDVFTI